MRYYKRNNEVFAYETIEERSKWGASDLIEMTIEEVHAHINPPVSKVVPVQVSRAQGKAALIQKGIWQDVLAYAQSITDVTERALAEVALSDTTHWQRSSPFLKSAAEALRLSDEQVDEIFIEASQIQL